MSLGNGKPVRGEHALLDHALHLSNLGLPVHWLQPPVQGGKAPIRCGWQKVPWQPPADLRRSFQRNFNVGIRTGAVPGARVCVVVLDLDSAQEIAWAIQNMPITPMRAITRRGEHWYYLYPPDGCIIPTRHRPSGRALDVNAQLAQVVCPPSTHPSGHIYRWVVPPSSELLRQVPQWKPHYFQSRAPVPAPKQLAPSAAVDVARALRRGRGFARCWRVAAESEGRGTQTYLLAVTLVHGLGLDAGTAYDLLAAEFNPRLPEPYTEDLLRRKVAEAQKATHATRPL